ncbi:MAG TPA: N-6 DNA methylase, partial [Gemmatimonadales bacterium]|nr:N-6 DNA methylase [Gemmatimonadales bacterium]
GLLARQRSRRGLISLVLGLDSVSRWLVVTVGFGGFPVLEMNLARPSTEAVVALGRLTGGSDASYLEFAARAADALAAETLSRRFFREFRATLDRMAAGLPGPMPAKTRHDLALLQLTRVLFLYFIQTKGWLGGRVRFLSEEVDGCLGRGRRIHRDLLRPLFFGTLNRPSSARGRAAVRFGNIPFLNGGLFEPHPLERRIRADIPNELWRDAFDGLFERFHFTVAERNRRGAVAPDMLGQVFEGVMEPRARRVSGTFYTPALLVGAVLDAAILAWLAGRLKCTESEAERRMGDPDPETGGVLASLTILDPAVGSGAFLLGALDRLVRNYSGTNLSVRKRSVLQHNLFGVDRSAAAVRLTELRLWLAVIADDPAERPELVAPLPNLDCLVRQGDSLFEPFHLSFDGAPGRPDLMDELSTLRRSVVTASGPGKQALVHRLRAAETRLVSESLEASEQRARANIEDCLSRARAHDLFGDRRGLDRALQAELTGLRDRVRALRQARRKLSREGEVPWFHYQSHFADVFARGGFDLVVGNPPWLRSEEIPPAMRDRLAGRYQWWRAGSPGYGNRPDLAVAFLERGIELVAVGGVIGMLVPAKILSARYGAVARHALASSVTLHVVADLTGDARAVFDATVYPMALIASRRAPPERHQVRTTIERSGSCRVLQAQLRGGGPWILRNGLRPVLEELERCHPRVADRFVCHLGLKTGANRVFLNPPDGLEPEVLRWAIRGRDLSPFRCKAGTRLLWTHDSGGAPRDSLPERCAAYLQPHYPELRARKDFIGGPPWMVFRAKRVVARYRVVWADLARQLTAAALTRRPDHYRIPLNSCYLISAKSAAEAERLTAWLNSTWLRAVARLKAVPAAGGFARFNAETIASLPLPGSVLLDPELVRLARAGRLDEELQEELDEIAARHLNLSRTARSALRAVVDGPANDRS